jgi:hypothetical protein
MQKFNPKDGIGQLDVSVGNLLLKAAERLTELAQSDDDRGNAAAAKYQGLTFLIRGYSEQKKDVSEYEKQLSSAFDEVEKYTRSRQKQQVLYYGKSLMKKCMLRVRMFPIR